VERGVDYVCSCPRDFMGVHCESPGNLCYFLDHVTNTFLFGEAILYCLAFSISYYRTGTCEKAFYFRKPSHFTLTLYFLRKASNFQNSVSILQIAFGLFVLYNIRFFIVKPKATCHITRQASINANALVRYPI